jgi:hypothetical protein
MAGCGDACLALHLVTDWRAACRGPGYRRGFKNDNNREPRGLAALGLAWACTAAAQPVYKWVDAEGRTHYGSQLLVDQADAGQIKVSPNGSSGAGSGRFGEERNPDGTKKLPKQVRELADGVAKGLSKVDSSRRCR